MDRDDSSMTVKQVVGPVDRLDLLVPLVLFAIVGVWVAVVWLPETWPVWTRVLSGMAIGLLSWMFPYLNRVLEG